MKRGGGGEGEEEMKSVYIYITAMVNDERGVCRSPVIAGKLRYYEQKKKKQKKTYVTLQATPAVDRKLKKKKENKSALQFVASYCLPQLAVDDPSLALPLPLFLPARLTLLLFSWPRVFRRFIMPFVRARGFYRLFNIYHPVHGCNTNFFGSRRSFDLERQLRGLVGLRKSRSHTRF